MHRLRGLPAGVPDRGDSRDRGRVPRMGRDQQGSDSLVQGQAAAHTETGERPTPEAREQAARLGADSETTSVGAPVGALLFEHARGGRHCGECSKCADRVLAFRRAGAPEPTGYAVGPGAAGLAPGTVSREPVAKRARTTRVAPKKATRLR